MTSPEGQRRLSSELVGFQPQDHEILSAFVALCTKGMPRNELLVSGLREAVKKAEPLLGRFLDDSYNLSRSAISSFEKLQDQRILIHDGVVFYILPEQRTKVESTMKMYFKETAVEMFREAAAAAEAVWFPTQ